MEEKSLRYSQLKVLAAFLVVFGHVARMYTGDGVVTPAWGSPVLKELFYLVDVVQMPLFLCLSGLTYGLCLEDLGKYRDKGAFLRKKAERLLLPYWAVGFFCVAPTMVLLGFAEEGYFSYCLHGILLFENPRHLWFLFVLFFIFMLFAALREPIRRCSPWALFPALLLLALASQRHYGTYPFARLWNFGGYSLLFFYLGYVGNRVYLAVTDRLKKPWVLGILFLLELGIYRTGFCASIFSALTGVLFFAGLGRWFPEKLTQKRWFQALKRDGMAVYLFHAMILYWCFYLAASRRIPPVVMTAASMALSYGLSMALAKLLRRGRLDMILGE